MTKTLIYVGACSVLFWACVKTPDSPKTQVSFEIENFRMESEAGCKSDTMNCAYYEVNYPEFSGLDTSVSVLLKKRIDKAGSMGNPEAEGESMKQIAEGFIKDYLDFSNEIPEVSSGWHYTADFNVEILTDTLLSISVVEEYYTGGAHGGNGKFFININPRTGADFQLSGLLKPGYESSLTELGEKQFRKVRELPDTTSLLEDHFEFPDDKFALNQNYGFTTGGIVFYFNSYEIAAYASGPTEVLIPYEEIKAWLK